MTIEFSDCVLNPDSRALGLGACDRRQLGDACMDCIENDRDFDSPRGRPRFKAMVNKAGGKAT